MGRVAEAALVLLAFAGTSATALAQNPRAFADTLSGVGNVIAAQLDRSYIAAGSGIGNVRRQLFEGNIAAHYRFQLARSSDRWIRGAVFTMRSVVRMRDVTSKPVRTPSYIPGVQLYFNAPWADTGTDHVVLGFTHYSNGQEFPSVNADGSFNEINGEYTSNLATLALSKGRTVKGGFLFLRGGVDRFFSQDSLSDIHYGKTRVHLSALALSSQRPGHEGHVELRFGWMPDGINHEGLRSVDAEVTLMRRWPALNDFGLFGSAYWGRDYYNIHYMRGTLSTIKLGVMAVGRDYGYKK